MRRFYLIAGLVLASSVACAPRTVVPPVAAAPRYPEFMKPTVPPRFAANPAVAHHDRAWLFLQAGDLQNAEREVAAALKSDPAFTVAEADAGYVALARKDAAGAIQRFERSLASQPAAAALVGKGLALEALDRQTEAVDAFRAALAADPSLTDLSRRVEVLRFRGLERSVAEARRAAQSGRPSDAVRIYLTAIESSPESEFLYRELADVERQRGNGDAALGHYRKALSLDPADALALARVGELLEARGELTEALSAYNDALAVGPDDQLEAKRNLLLARMEQASLPAEYQAIKALPEITRGDLAALIGVRLEPWLQQLDQRDVGVITDIRSHWAERWILAVARGGVMDAFANHAFEPRAVVRRAEVAQIVTRLLSRTTAMPRSLVATWQDARLGFADVPTGHAAYGAASFAVAAGVLSRTGDGSFEPARAVSGAESVALVDRVRTLIERPPAQRGARP